MIAPRVDCSFSRSAAARIASTGANVYVWVGVRARTDSPNEQPTLDLLLQAAYQQPSTAIEFVRYELDSRHGWPETQGTPQVFVDDWLEPPGELKFTRSHLPWADLLVSFGRGVRPKLTNAAEENWREQYLRESNVGTAGEAWSGFLFFLGIWIVSLGGVIFAAVVHFRAFSAAAVGICVGAALLIATGLALIYGAARLAPIPKSRAWGSDEACRTQNLDQPRSPSG